MKDIKLVALDLDGTLFDNSSRISERNLTAIRSITDKGIHVVISTGRPFEGIPLTRSKAPGSTMPSPQTAAESMRFSPENACMKMPWMKSWSPRF